MNMPVVSYLPLCHIREQRRALMTFEYNRNLIQLISIYSNSHCIFVLRDKMHFTKVFRRNRILHK